MTTPPPLFPDAVSSAMFKQVETCKISGVAKTQNDL